DQGGIAGDVDVLQRRHQERDAFAAAGGAAEEDFEICRCQKLALPGGWLLWAKAGQGRGGAGVEVGVHGRRSDGAVGDRMSKVGSRTSAGEGRRAILSTGY